MQSLCELTEIPDSLAKVLVDNFPCQLCFSFPFCTADCVEGLLRVCATLTKYGSSSSAIPAGGRLSVVIPAYCLDLKREIFSVLFERLSSHSCIKSVGIFNITEMSQLSCILKRLKVGQPRSSVRYLKMKFQDIVQECSDDFPERPFAECTEGIEIYQCSIPTVVEKIIHAIPSSTSMGSIVVSGCNVNPEGCKLLSEKVKFCTSLNEFRLVDHSLNTACPLDLTELLSNLSVLGQLEIFHMSRLPTFPITEATVLSSLKGTQCNQLPFPKIEEDALSCLKNILCKNQKSLLSTTK